MPGVFLKCSQRRKDGKIHRSWSVVESRRHAGGKITQQHVLYLGEINDSQQRAWEKTIAVFDEVQGETRQLALFPADRLPPADGAEAVQVRLDELRLEHPRQWGACWLGDQLWRQLHLDDFFGARLPLSREGTDWEKVLRILAIYRLLSPGSEWRLHRHWFATTALGDLLGVDGRAVQDDTLYRCLDLLLPHKEALFGHLRQRWSDLFGARYEVLLYDLTSTYFEGQGPPGLGAHGRSRDGKPRQRQVLVGVVMVEDWPLAHHVFRGNRRDATTVRQVLADLEQRFGLRRLVFVGDRGMVTADNLHLLQSRGQGYLVGLNRRRNAAVSRYLERATGPWTECPGGKGAQEKTDPPKTYVQEVASGQPGVRVFIVRSDERLAYERTERRKAMERAGAELQALARRVQHGKLKAAEKVGAAAARILGRHHGSRYFAWEYTDGRFRFFEHPVSFPREEALEGTYVLQTSEPHLTPVQAVAIYKGLSEVERAFAHLKDVIALRPIYHQTDRRVEAHIFVAALAFLLHRALEKKLKAAGLDLSATEALQALRTVRVVDFHLADGHTKRSVTRGTARAASILAALGITALDPPTPAKEAPTVA